MIEKNTVPDSAVKTIKSFFSDGRQPHAILVDGGSEQDRISTALLTAQMLVCENKDVKPCGECEHCRKAADGIHPDIITVAKPDDKKYFVKADVKNMVADAYLTPNESAVKVYIIKELQCMNEECQNLLLKILEEPPVYTAFVLTSQTSNAVIGTVLSRVVRLRLGKIAQTEYSDKAKETAGKFAISLLSVYEYDRIEAIACVDGNKQLTAEVLALLLEILRDAIVLKSGGKILLYEFSDESKKLSNGFELKKLIEMYDTVCTLLRSLENNPNYTLLTAVLCANL